MKHVLIKTAFAFEQRISLHPLDGFLYNEISGFWVDCNGKLMIHDDHFAGVGSKKFDIETGEDKKGK